jgi:hypothetical protein
MWWVLLLLGLLAACTEAPAEVTSAPRLIGEETLPPPTVTPLQLQQSLTPTEIAVGVTPTFDLTPGTVPARLITATPPNSPTPTITDTPTITPRPSSTRTPTPSLTPTASDTPIPTITLTPSITFTPSPTSECGAEWFFEPAPATCPLTMNVLTEAAYQPMQDGFMIWTQSGLNIFIFFYNGGWVVTPDTYREGEPEVDFNMTIPPGLLQPRRGFGKVWRNDLTLRNQLGWATSAEVGYLARIQSDAVTGIRYVSGPNEQVYALSPDGTQWWEVE